MSLLKKTHEHIRNAYLKEVLLALDDFLDIRYTFRCEKRYQGWFGKIKAEQDRDEAERRAVKWTVISTTWHFPQTSINFGSDPDACEEFARRARERHRTHNFSVSLMRHIETRGLDPVSVYKRANIDRKLFSKIKTNIDYIPSKKTILALSFALELSLDETLELLKLCGYTLSPDILADVIVEFFISRGKYDLDEVNAALYAYDQPIF